MLWLLPDPDSKERLKKIINRLSDQFSSPKFEPHITLGTVPSLPLDSIKSKMAELVRDEFSFKTFLCPAECGEPSFQRFTSEVKPVDHFLNLSIKTDRLFEGKNGKRKNFHVSLLYGQTDCEMLHNYISESQIRIPNHVYVQKIALVSISGSPEEWELIHVAHLLN